MFMDINLLWFCYILWVYLIGTSTKMNLVFISIGLESYILKIVYVKTKDWPWIYIPWDRWAVENRYIG